MDFTTVNIFLDIDESYTAKTKYVFHTFCSIIGLKAKFFRGLTSEDIQIYYGKKTKDVYPIKIYHDITAPEFFSKKEKYPEENANLIKYGLEYLPFLFSMQGDVLTSGSQSVTIRKDIISSAFYFLTCWQEHVADVSPEQKYEFSSSLQNRFDFSEIPPVDRYAKILEDVLKMAFPLYTKKKVWPSGKQFAVSLSHNIDYWNFRTKEDMTKLNARRRESSGYSANSFFKLLLHNIDKKWFFDPAEQIKSIIKIEAKYRASSSFFVLTKPDLKDEKLNYFSDPKIFQQILNIFNTLSFNLQGTKEAGFDIGILSDELVRLKGFSANGFRVRYLNMNYQKLFNNLETAKIKYDSSMGFYDKTGYAAGISYPFRPYNLEEDRPFNVLEIPSVISDRTLHINFRSNAKKAEQYLQDIFSRSANFKSHVSLSWHNHVFDKIDFPGWGKLYKKLLYKAYTHNAWICNLDEMWEYWKSR